MASTGRSSTLFVQVLFVLALALLLATSMADSDFHWTGLRDMKVPKQSPVNCNSENTVPYGDKCISIYEPLILTTTDLSALNPNLICDQLFVGQWLCINGESAE